MNPTPVETCCVFFEPGFAEAQVRDATRSLALSLDDPLVEAPEVDFLTCLHPDRERRLCDLILLLARECRGEIAPSASEEAFAAVAMELLGYYREIRRQMARLPAVKESTREELFRRLLIAREYLHGHSRQTVSLRETARAACLSTYHFHRAFAQAFGSTPHQYLTGLRLERAKELLASGKPVIDACVEVGFSSAPTFSRRFRARFGGGAGCNSQDRIGHRGIGLRDWVACNSKSPW